MNFFFGGGGAQFISWAVVLGQNYRDSLLSTQINTYLKFFILLRVGIYFSGKKHNFFLEEQMYNQLDFCLKLFMPSNFFNLICRPKLYIEN